jgi:hypothetical protein
MMFCFLEGVSEHAYQIDTVKRFIWVATLLASTTLLADSITTLSGKKYSGATVTRVEPDGLSITYDDGLAKIPFTDLAPEIRTKYGYDPQKAAEWKAQIADAQRKAVIRQQEAQRAEQQRKAALAQRQAEEAERRATEQQQAAKQAAQMEAAKTAEARRALRASIKTIKEIETDMPSALNKKLYVQGTIDVDNYYNYAFQDAETGFYCFKIADDTGRAWVYMKRGEASEGIRKQILAAKGPLRGAFCIAIPAAIYSSGQGQVLGFLYDVRPPLDDE